MAMDRKTTNEKQRHLFMAKLRLCLELTKPRILSMVLVTTTLGFFLGGRDFHPLPVFFFTLFGMGCATGGSAMLNNYLERNSDARMGRTRDRALPAGLIEPAQALMGGVGLVIFGVLLLVWTVNLLAGFLVLLAAFLYVLVYTPMKRISWLNTTLGAIPGAIPPVAGWVAATGRIDPGAWVLFAILFAWQHPHFFAIAWMFRDDYRAAGFKMLPVVEPGGESTFRQTLAFSFLLVGLSLLPTVIGMAGWFYFCGALVLGLVMLAVAVVFARNHGTADARRLLKASVLYLPLLLLFIILDAV
jgi:protoheme IX farnesyltransferase